MMPIYIPFHRNTIFLSLLIRLVRQWQIPSPLVVIHRAHMEALAGLVLPLDTALQDGQVMPLGRIILHGYTWMGTSQLRRTFLILLPVLVMVHKLLISVQVQIIMTAVVMLCAQVDRVNLVPILLATAVPTPVLAVHHVAVPCRTHVTLVPAIVPTSHIQVPVVHVGEPRPTNAISDLAIVPPKHIPAPAAEPAGEPIQETVVVRGMFVPVHPSPEPAARLALAQGQDLVILALQQQFVLEPTSPVLAIRLAPVPKVAIP
jgi:hypothetical protein